jgi:monoamine oxidase
MRQCYYFGTDTHDSHSLFLASYNDMQSVPFWDVLESKDLEHWHPHPHKPHRIGTRTLEPQTWKKHARWTPRATSLAPQHEIDKFLDVQAPAAMVREAMAQVRELHGNAHIPDPYITHFKNWTEDPFGAGYHAWKAGVNVAEVMRYMRRPEPAEAIHICGEAYSDQQGWVEGALCVAERMLQEHFALACPEWLNPKYYLGW